MLMTFIEERYRLLLRYAALKVRVRGRALRTGCCSLGYRRRDVGLELAAMKARQ